MKKIGIVIGNYHSDHPSRMVKSLWEQFRGEDVELTVYLSTESAMFMKDIVLPSSHYDYQYASLCSYSRFEHPDLLIVSAGTLSIYQNNIPLREFLDHLPDIPVILMETDCEPAQGIYLIADNAQGLDDCVEHLITVHGLERIGFIAGPQNNRDSEGRFAGYCRALARHGIPLREEYIAQGDYSEHVDQAVEELLDRNPDLQAIASANDEMTVAVYRVCAKRGLRVGRDLAVTGFDDMLMARYMDPPLTTARQDLEALPRETVASALSMLRGEKVSSRCIPAPLVRRCSCGCAHPAKEERTPKDEGTGDLFEQRQKERDYHHRLWIAALLIRELQMKVEDPKEFFGAVAFTMKYLGAKSSYLCLFDHPLDVEAGTIAEHPQRLYVMMRQAGDRIESFAPDEAPTLLRDGEGPGPDTRAPGSYMAFLLFDERHQYGTLNVAIEPAEIDLFYVVSMELGTSLRYLHLWNKQKRYREELRKLAAQDSLTGLLNRNGLEERLTSFQTEKPLYAVLMADLDHLKEINDHLGHFEGDEALKTAANLLRQVCGEQAAIARVGGDEFLAICPVMNEEEAAGLPGKITAACEAYNRHSGKPYELGISSGLAVADSLGNKDATRRADEALYRAKQSRRPFVMRQADRTDGNHKGL